VLTTHPHGIRDVEEQIATRAEVLECHHVTGGYTLLLKVRTADTSTLEE
jgi:DNA-binding Lrp family transcriptional regulator